MFTEIIFKGERIITSDVAGYPGCEVVCQHGDMPGDEEDLMCSAQHMTQMHTLKALEANLILSGVEISEGILAEEAEATGVDVVELARAVRENARSQRSLEIKRRARKVRERKPQAKTNRRMP